MRKFMKEDIPENMDVYMNNNMPKDMKKSTSEYMKESMLKDMNKYMNDYMTDDELEKFISEVEKNDLVKAPSYIEKKVFDEIDKVKQIAEYKRFRNRVMVSIAAIIVFSSLMPLWEKIIPNNISRTYYISEKLNTGILTSREDYENVINEKKPGMETKDNAANEKKPGSETKDDVLDDEDISKFGNSYYISNLLNKRED